MRTYASRNLKEQFPQLTPLQDFTLIPLLDSVFCGWLKQIPDSAVSDIRKESGRYTDTYNCVVDGKIVSVLANGADIDVCDDDETWYAVESVSFNGEDSAEQKLFEHFQRFVRAQKLEDLAKASAEELRKGKTYHLSQEMSNFYLGGAFTQASFRRK